MTNEERIQRVREQAINRAADYSGCSQAVLGAIQDEFGIGNKESFKAATALLGELPTEAKVVVLSSVSSWHANLE